jgi:uncharacterized protein YlaI
MKKCTLCERDFKNNEVESMRIYDGNLHYVCHDCLNRLCMMTYVRERVNSPNYWLNSFGRFKVD